MWDLCQVRGVQSKTHYIPSKMHASSIWDRPYQLVGALSGTSSNKAPHHSDRAERVHWLGFGWVSARTKAKESEKGTERPVSWGGSSPTSSFGAGASGCNPQASSTERWWGRWHGFSQEALRPLLGRNPRSHRPTSAAPDLR